MKQILIAFVLVLAGALSRTILHIGPNFEVVTVSAVLAGVFIKNKKIALSVPLITMFITDSIIGNTNIFLFTWSAYILMPLFGAISKRVKTNSNLNKVLLLEGAGLISLVIFFLWTNLGVVLTTNMYDKNIQGLISSYINALPFLKPQIFSTVVSMPIMMMIINLLQSIQFKSRIKVTQKDYQKYL